MLTKSDHASSLEHLSQGIDRNDMDVYERKSPASQIQHQTTVDSAKVSPARNVLASAREFSMTVQSKVKKKTKEALHIKIEPDQQHASLSAPTLAPLPDDDTSESRLEHDLPERKHRPVKEMLKNPMEIVQSVVHMKGGNQFAEKFDQKTIPHGADVRLVKAYDAVTSAETEKEKTAAVQDLNHLKGTRQDAFVRWTVDKHVREIRKLPIRTVPWRQRDEFRKLDRDGKVHMDSVAYYSHLLLYYSELHGGRYIGVSEKPPPATEEALISNVERLLVTTLPFQEFYMKTRRIYRWENRKETTIYLVSYAVLWWMDYFAGFAILMLLLLVIRRRLYPPTVEDFRGELRRSEDINETALSVSQLVEQHGKQEWANALIQEVGPTFMLQLEDLTNILEILRNFYEWRDPARTKRALCLLGVCWLVFSVISTLTLMKTMFLVVGIMFFGFWPISSRFPQYRLLVSPMTWLFWNIPTHAEWAIARLKAEAIGVKRDMSDIHNRAGDMNTPRRQSTDACTSDTTATCVEDFEIPLDQHHGDKAERKGPSDATPISESIDITLEAGRYHCKSRDHLGKLSISTEGVKFNTAVRSHEQWSLRYSELKSVKKVTSYGPGQDLLFISESDQEFRAENMALRDEAFTQIIGYSPVDWRKV